MVVVDLVAQIQPAAAEVVIKQAEANVIAAGDGEWNVFVQRVSTNGVVAHRVEVTHLVTFTVALQIAGFISEAIKAFIFTTALIVCHAIAVGIQQISAGRAVIHQRQPFAFVVTIVPLQPQRLGNGCTQ
ncbi:Uncharacterised protein [Shigella sonnei]|nr:Uncharacterised protein [Shigella sonnei]